MTSSPQVWMFSGQGSQYYRMGADLYGSDAVFRNTMDWCAGRVQPALGCSLTELLFRPRADRFEPFTRTLYTHPALFSIQYSLAQALRSRGLRPDVLLGYSLGEWVAHAVAGVIPADRALDLLVGQAQELEAAGPHGGMLAVLDSPELVDRQPGWFDGVWVAARNFARHFVVTGETAAIDGVEARLKGQQVTTQRLPVSQPFHSPLMDRYGPGIRAALRESPLEGARIPIFSARGEEVTRVPAHEGLWRALRDAVAFSPAVAMLESLGSPTYIDCGPSGTLAAFVKYNLPGDQQRRCVPLITPFDRNLDRIHALAGGARGAHS